MNKTLRKAMISTIAMLVVGVMSLTGVTYAWFTQGNDATVTEFNVNVQAADGSLTLAMPNDLGVLTWTTTIAPGAPANALRPVSNVTGATSAFYHATISGADASKLGSVTTLSTDTSVVGEGADQKTYNNWYAFDFYINNMTSANQMTVTLKSNTGFIGDSAKALRIAFIQDGYMVDASGAFNTANNYSKAEGATASTVIFEPNSTAEHSAAATANVATNGGNTTYAISGADAIDNAIYGQGAGKTAQSTFDNTTTAIATLPANSVAKVTVVIWLEGQDVDCNNDIAAIAMTLPISLHATFTAPVSGT